MERIPEAKRLYCPHCDANISKSTWYRHYNQYYDPTSDRWETATKNLEADFQFDTDSDEGDGETVPRLKTRMDLDFNDDAIEMVS